MRLLLDTRALIWWTGKDPNLKADVRAQILNDGNAVFVSVATIWEMAIKSSLGKLKTPDNIKEMLAHYRFTTLPITADHAIAAGALPLIHNDPFDRMLVAQAQLGGLTIVSRDPRMKHYNVGVLET